MSKPANSPRASLGNAAAAIIAALSVDKPGEGKYTGYGNPAVLAAARRPELHATPPDTIRLHAPFCPADAAARRSSSVMTACWNEANKSNVAFGVTCSHCAVEGAGVSLRSARRR